MKILKQGKIQELNKIICENCDTEFIYELSDIKKRITKDIECNFTMGGTWDDYIKRKEYYVECPLCKRSFVIDSEIISVNTLTFSEMFGGKTKEFEKRIGWND